MTDVEMAAGSGGARPALGNPDGRGVTSSDTDHRPDDAEQAEHGPKAAMAQTDQSSMKPSSPLLRPRDFAGRTAQEIDEAAKEAGLIPKGPDPINGMGSYVDPVTGRQRILIHANESDPHMHVNDPSGTRLDFDGRPTEPNSPDAHLPVRR